MANGDFFSNLNQLRNSDFLGGFRVAGQAAKETKQNESLVDLYNQFRTKQNELTSTEQQVGEFKDSPEGKEFADQSKNIANNIDQTLGLAESLQKMTALNDLYQPYIAAMATLGEDGQRLSRQLANDLSNKIQMEEFKSKIPAEELAYQNALTTYKWNNEKYQQYLDDAEYKDQVNEIVDMALTMPEYQAVPEGHTKVYNKGDALAWTSQVNTLRTALKKQLEEKGVEYNAGVFTDAIGMALEQGGKQLSTNLDPRVGLGAQKLRMQINSMVESSANRQSMLNQAKNKMADLAKEFVRLSPDLRRDWRKYRTTGIIPQREVVADDGSTQMIDKYDKGMLDELTEKFGAGGQYWAFQSVLKAHIPNVDDYVSTKTLKSGVNVNHWVSKELQGLYWMNNSSDFQRGGGFLVDPTEPDILAYQAQQAVGARQDDLPLLNDKANLQIKGAPRGVTERSLYEQQQMFLKNYFDTEQDGDSNAEEINSMLFGAPAPGAALEEE